MKIYNKKTFAEGIFMAAIGTLLLITDLINHTVDTEGMILTIILYFLGGGWIIRSLSHTYAKEDKLDKMDERNQLIELKSKSRAFRLTQIISFLLMLAFQITGKVTGHDEWIAMGTGLAFSFGISMFAEIATYVYYESKN